MANFRFSRITAAVSALFMLTSCGKTDSIAENSDFLFDTYSHMIICGSNSEETMKALTQIHADLDASFKLCYTTEAIKLPNDEAYSDCTAITNELADKYGTGINIACGELTELWGISTTDPTVPTERDILETLTKIPDDNSYTETTMLDFGAVAKGYACDKAYELLTTTETDYATVSLGSSTLLYGEKPNGKFRAGVTNPDKENSYLGIIETDAAFISTSGGYERFFEADGKRYSHILDMETGYPVETDLTSVTVIVPAETADGGIMSDFLSTLIYIQGTAQLDKWLAYEEFEVIAADENGVVYSDCSGFILDENSGYSYGK
ncbi:MAG: FAD:protein FMN transferase [Oscillospiraceae bacterium]|nr:FAD:protein FMN transferase [Oscillospiraceae bacterium]